MFNELFNQVYSCQGLDGDIQLFNVILHTHLAGTAVRVRHMRNGQELPFIGKDDTYDFNFQV